MFLRGACDAVRDHAADPISDLKLSAMSSSVSASAVSESDEDE